jgi:hypothetical protein
LSHPAIPNLAIKPDGFPKYRQFSLIFKSATTLLHKIMPKPVRFGFEFGITVFHLHRAVLLFGYIMLLSIIPQNR